MQRTVQLSPEQREAKSPGLTPSEVHAAAIKGQHVKQAKRLLRLFRHALAKQSSASQSAPASDAPHTVHGGPGLTAAAESGPTAAEHASLSGVKPAAGQAASALQSSAPQASEAESDQQTVFLVEATIPWELASLSSCQTPCLFTFSISPGILPGQHLGSIGVPAPGVPPAGSLEGRRAMAEQLVMQALKDAFQDCEELDKLHISSSVKVNLARSQSDTSMPEQLALMLMIRSLNPKLQEFILFILLLNWLASHTRLQARVVCMGCLGSQYVSCVHVLPCMHECICIGACAQYPME